MTRGRWILAAGLGAALGPTASSPPSRASTPASPDAEAEADAGLVAKAAVPGPPIDSSSPPGGSDAWPSACSFRYPLCVRPAPGTPGSVAAAALLAAERAWRVVTGALALPPPDGGLDGAWQVYLVDGAEARVRAPSLLDARDLRGHIDRASSFAAVDRRTPPGCALDVALARAVARGSLWRAAPATDAGSADAAVEAIAQLATPCSTGQERDDAIDFEAAPERTVVDARSPSFNRGAAMFFAWLDRRFGARPGAVLLGLWAVAPTMTPPDACRWAGTPTGFDVLRASLGSALWQGSTLDDVFAAFAAARASMDPAPSLTWNIAWPLQARRLASAEPVGPTGASYVLVDHASAPRGAKLRVEAAWEDYARMRWIVLKLDAAGKVLEELPIASADRATEAAKTIENLDDVSRVVVLGVNLGSTEMPFDPDDGVWEPHGWLLTLRSEDTR